MFVACVCVRCTSFTAVMMSSVLTMCPAGGGGAFLPDRRFPAVSGGSLDSYSDIKDGGRSLKQTAVISYVNVVFWSETEEAERDPDSLRPGWRGVSAVQRKHLRPGSEQLGVSTRARFSAGCFSAARFTAACFTAACFTAACFTAARFSAARFTAARFTEKVWVTDCLLQYQLQPRDGVWAFLMVSYSSVLCQVHVFLFFVSFL